MVRDIESPQQLIDRKIAEIHELMKHPKPVRPERAREIITSIKIRGGQIQKRWDTIETTNEEPHADLQSR